MTKYGRVAVLAAEALRSGRSIAPRDAWYEAAEAVFPESASAPEKGCPRDTFLAICETGRLAGAPGRSYTRSVRNKGYTLRALDALDSDPGLLDDRGRLWGIATEGSGTQHNQQMDVVLALWETGLLR